MSTAIPNVNTSTLSAPLAATRARYGRTVALTVRADAVTNQTLQRQLEVGLLNQWHQSISSPPRYVATEFSVVILRAAVSRQSNQFTDVVVSLTAESATDNTVDALVEMEAFFNSFLF